jgi:hypothetical protein
MSKVQTNLVDRLIKNYGDPGWHDMEFVMSQWEGSFKDQSEERLQEAADIYIRNSKTKYFPTIAHIREILDREVVKPASGHLPYLASDLMLSWSDYTQWRDSLVGRDGREVQYKMLLDKEKLDLIDSTVREFIKAEPGIVEEYDVYNWRETHALAWKHGWLPWQVDNELARRSTASQSESRKYLKSIMKLANEKKGNMISIFGKLMLKYMPYDLRVELTNDLKAEKSA